MYEQDSRRVWSPDEEKMEWLFKVAIFVSNA